MDDNFNLFERLKQQVDKKYAWGSSNENCKNCENCTDCKFCLNCKNCDTLLQGINCIGCKESTGLYNCIHSERCMNSDNLAFCYRIKDKYDSYWLFNEEVTKDVFQLIELKYRGQKLRIVD